MTNLNLTHVYCISNLSNISVESQHPDLTQEIGIRAKCFVSQRLVKTPEVVCTFVNQSIF